MKKDIAIHWFRQDLRLSDNPSLIAATGHANALPVYIFDTHNAGKYFIGEASRWWLHHSIKSLNGHLNNHLSIYKGDPADVLMRLIDRHNATAVYWNRCYEPWQIKRDKKIKLLLKEKAIRVESFNGSLFNEPWKIRKKDGTPYKVFTPYHNQASMVEECTDILPAANTQGSLLSDSESITLDELSLLPKNNWDTKFHDLWTPGEVGAQSSLDEFLNNGLRSYKEGRDFPASNSVSKLSPHLHFGEISVRKINKDLLSLPDDNNKEHFKRELHWREFSYYLLFHWPDLPHKNLKASFDYFPWSENAGFLSRWQKGLTGYPMVDAGMRELWETGFMHNRVRMIAASFLVKNLLIDWRLGASWFWHCLVDADLASNSASWQWVAGCGTDASPYFRVFNPVTQGDKFDPQGDYTRRYIPELKELPNQYLFCPWKAPTEVLRKANVALGQTYPLPIVDLKQSREKALAAYGKTKSLLNL